MGYRDNVRYVKKEAFWTVRTFAVGVIGAVVLVGAIGWVMKSSTKVGDTIVERVVLKNSYQRSSAYEARIATIQANLAEVNAQLASNPSPNVRSVLEAQAASLRVQLASAKAQQ